MYIILGIIVIIIIIHRRSYYHHSIYLCFCSFLLLVVILISVISTKCLVLPVCHAGFVKCHEIDLTRGAALRAREEHLIVALAEELQTLRLFMHEDAV